MRLRGLLACIVVVMLAACGARLPDDLGLPTALTGAEPRTLDAATAAAQERSDRFASRDFAGAWLVSSAQFQAAVSQADYVEFQETCTRSRDFLPTTITGVRLEGDSQAIIREKDVMGVQNSITMVYEDGKWLQAPSDYWVTHAHWAADQLIAERRAEGKCGGDGLTPPPVVLPSSPTPATTETPPRASARTIDELLADSPSAGERPIVSGLKDQGYGYLNYEMVSIAWDRTCWMFGGAHGASEIAINDARSELLGMQFTPAEADAIIGIALEVHGSTGGIEGCG